MFSLNFTCYNHLIIYYDIFAFSDTLLIGVCNSLTSLYAGLVVFGVVGFISEQTGTDIDKVFFRHLGSFELVSAL